MKNKTPTQQVDVLNSASDSMLDKEYPYKTFTIKQKEPLYFTENLRRMKEKVKRLYKKKNDRYYSLKKAFVKKHFEAKKLYYGPRLDKLKTDDPKGWHAEMAALMKNGGVRQSSAPPAVNGMDGKTDVEKANMVADHIEAITKSYEKLRAAEVAENYPGGTYKALSQEEVARAKASRRKNQ